MIGRADRKKRTIRTIGCSSGSKLEAKPPGTEEVYVAQKDFSIHLETGKAMNSASLLKTIAVFLAVVGLCLPEPLFAATTANPSPGVIDVELHDGGVLLGQLVDPQGLPMAETAVILLEGPKRVAETQTDAHGNFAFRGLHGGVYQLTAAEGIGAYRLWAPGTAPPSAQAGALVVAGEDLVRGQFRSFGRNCGSWCRFQLSRPIVLGALVATAIAVPIVVHNAGKGGPASPP